MRALVDYVTNEILQVEKTPETGAPVPVNGKYVVPVPDGAALQPDRDSVVLPTADPNSIVALSFAGLLAQLPQYDSVLYNPLITDTDVDDLDLVGPVIINGNTYSPRLQTGRQTGGPFVSGQASNTTVILPVNDTLGGGNERPGVLVTDTIDISPFLPPAPPGACEIPAANDFLVWWKLYDFDVTEDICSDFGKFAGENTPSLRNILEVDQEPSGLEVYISTDDGISWVRVNLLDPVRTCCGTQVRLAFLNFSTARFNLASYAILF